MNDKPQRVRQARLQLKQATLGRWHKRNVGLSMGTADAWKRVAKDLGFVVDRGPSTGKGSIGALMDAIALDVVTPEELGDALDRAITVRLEGGVIDLGEFTVTPARLIPKKRHATKDENTVIYFGPSDKGNKEDKVEDAEPGKKTLTY